MKVGSTSEAYDAEAWRMRRMLEVRKGGGEVKGTKVVGSLADGCRRITADHRQTQFATQSSKVA